MCGRFAQIEPMSDIIRTFFIDEVITDTVPRYNIAPGSRIQSVIMNKDKRLLVDYQWGLVPYWAKDPAIGQKLINARGETVHQKPSFRNAFKQRRCLIPASGFYEWKKEGKGKSPYFVRLKTGNLFTFAGLHETWKSPAGEELRTCTIVTTAANSVMAPIHDRMPLIIPGECRELWLDPAALPEDLLALVAPYRSDEMEVYPVSPLVNSPGNDSPDCIAPLE